MSVFVCCYVYSKLVQKLHYQCCYEKNGNRSRDGGWVSSKRRGFSNPISLERCPASTAKLSFVQTVASWCLFLHLWNHKFDNVAPENPRIKRTIYCVNCQCKDLFGGRGGGVVETYFGRGLRCKLTHKLPMNGLRLQSSNSVQGTMLDRVDMQICTTLFLLNAASPHPLGKLVTINTRQEVCISFWYS